MFSAGRYLAAMTLLNLLWEVVQLPLYTIWFTGTLPEITFAVLHCTAGDGLIAFVCLSASLVGLTAASWPHHRFGAVAVSTILLGVGYTIYSEWHNTTVSKTWAYASSMPTIFDIGVSPIAQWVFIPGLAFWWTHRRIHRGNAQRTKPPPLQVHP